MNARRVKTKTVYVAMSGGVDSSVAALLLKRQGFSVVGVFMKPWQTPGVRCLWQADRRDAARVTAALNIPLLTWDFSREYGRAVAREMISEYKKGRTPNPDVLCNQHIKFGLFYERAMARGADAVATGHYARIIRHSGTAMLATAADTNKDQTYFLWAVRPACLKRTLFPIGHLTKPAVRALALKAGLVTAGKKDSQGVCFVGDLDMKSFLMKHIKPRAGSILHTDGRVLGTHDGAAYYTIGQRHGLDIRDGGGPYYVIATDIRKNTVTVGTPEQLSGTTARLVGMNWFGPRPKSTERISVKIRYRTRAHPAHIDSRGKVHFSVPVRAVTPGQSAVLYKGSRLLGGGVIA